TAVLQTAQLPDSRKTSSSATNVSSSRTSSTKPCPHGDTSDSESEDSGKTSKPSDLTPGPSANGNGKPSKKPDDSSTKEKLKMAAIVAGVAALVGAAAVVAAPVALAGIGFTSSGVAAGSMAAAYQATLGGFIAKGSVFAVLQSFGAAGIPAAVQGGIAAAGATVGGGITALFRGSGKGPDAGGGNSSGKGPDEGGGNGSGKGPDEGGDSGGILTGAEADARKGAKGDEGAKGTGEGSRLRSEEGYCAKKGVESKRYSVKCSDVKSAENVEGQETCRQNKKNEEAARKQRAPPK
ncbi:hypothetical protein MTO96_040911, partial [Rhipicephalus appendiculatus]